MNAYQKYQDQLLIDPKVWLITGVAGFIGSNLLEKLLKLNQRVVGLDNFSTGYQRNLNEVKLLVTAKQWNRFQLIEGDIRNPQDCQTACAGVDYVLHEAALGSVPRSIENPNATNETNISGFLNMLVAARNVNVIRFVYAASSSTYGDHPGLPKVEDCTGKPLSPYAVTKYVNEVYADVFSRCYGFNSIGLRYFNVFGKRQDPNGSYAAVIPKWINAIFNQEKIDINGDGETSRDFTYVENIVQLNILAALRDGNEVNNQIFNAAAAGRTTLNQLHDYLSHAIEAKAPGIQIQKPNYRDFRAGDVRHSLADISKSMRLLGYMPTHQIQDGLNETVEWYLTKHSKSKTPSMKAL